MSESNSAFRDGANDRDFLVDVIFEAVYGDRNNLNRANEAAENIIAAGFTRPAVLISTTNQESNPMTTKQESDAITAAKDIDTDELLAYIRDRQSELGRWVLGQDFEEPYASMPHKVLWAKLDRMIRRGLIQGCTCGCRGDFEITNQGCERLMAKSLEAKQ